MNVFVSSYSALRGRQQGLVPWLLSLARGPLAAPRAPSCPPLTSSQPFEGLTRGQRTSRRCLFHIWTQKCQMQVRSCVLASAAGHGAAGRALIRAALPVLAGRFQAPCQWASLFSQQGQQASSKQPHSCLLYRLCLARDCGPKGTTM